MKSFDQLVNLEREWEYYYSRNMQLCIINRLRKRIGTNGNEESYYRMEILPSKEADVDDLSFIIYDDMSSKARNKYIGKFEHRGENVVLNIKVTPEYDSSVGIFMIMSPLYIPVILDKIGVDGFWTHVLLLISYLMLFYSIQYTNILTLQRHSTKFLDSILSKEITKEEMACVQKMC